MIPRPTILGALRSIAWVVGSFIPVRKPAQCQLDWADMLNAREESTEALEPSSDFHNCTCPSKQAADRDDHWLACPARTTTDPSSTTASATSAVGGDGPDGDSSIRREPPSGHPIAPAAGDAAGTGPAEASVPPTPPSAGHPDRLTQIAHVAELIDEQMFEDAEVTATRIVDMLAADWRIANSTNP